MSKKAERTIYLEKHIANIRKRWVNSNNPYKWEILDAMGQSKGDYKYFFELGYKKAKRDLGK